MLAQDRYVDVNGIQIHYLDWGGDGPVCVMFHGAGMCGGTWEPIVQRLAGRMHCIAPDLRSHGKSAASTAPVTWDLLAQDLAGFVNALDAGPVIIVAHSFRAGAALLASQLMPDRVAGGYLVEPTLLAQLAQVPEDRERARLARQGVRNKRREFRSHQEMFDAIKGRGGFRFVTDESLWAYVNHGTQQRPDGSVELRCSPETEAAFFEAQADPISTWPPLAQIAYPVTLVYSEGRYNSTQSWKQHEPIVRRFEGMVQTRFVITPGTHNTVMEHPDIHVRNILELVDQIANEAGG